MKDVFLTDMARAFAIFFVACVLLLVYCYFRARTTFKPQQGKFFIFFLKTAQQFFYSKYILGPAALAGIVSLFFAESLAAVLTIGGFFMGLLYLIFSQRP